MFQTRLPAGVAASCLLLAVPISAQTRDQGSSPRKVEDRRAEGTTRRGTSQDDIVVIAQRAREAVIADAAARLDSRAGATTLVTADEFVNGRATTLGDIMAFAPGVFAQTRHGEEVRFSIRGSGIQRGFLARGLQLYQDGVPMNLADGSGDYQSIDPLSVDHIEVWRGGNALEYGSSTLGGAVNFVMPDGRTADPLRVRADAGSFGQRRVHAMVAGAGDTLDAVVSATFAKQDGWREQSATLSTRLLGTIGYRLSDTITARLYLTHIDSHLELPGSLSRAALATDRRQAAPNSTRLNAGNNYLLNRAAARLSWQPDARSEVTVSAYVSDRDRFHPMTFGILDQQSTDYGTDVRAMVDLGDGDRVRRLVVGVSSAAYDGIEDRFTNPNGRPGVRTGTNDLTARLYNLYAEYTHGLTADVSLQLGAQATRATRRLDNLLMPAGSYRATFDAFSPKLGVIWRASPEDRIFANLSRSFEPAPFNEAPVRPVLPIPDAQRATTAEVGWRRRAGPVELEATAYRAWISNELLALTDDAGNSIGTANADRTIHQGLELGAKVPIGRSIGLRATYLLNDFHFDGDHNYADNRIAGLPIHLVHAEVEWRATTWLAVAPSLEWQPSGTWIDHANTIRQPGYMLAHLRGYGDIGRNLRWFADVRNLLDKAYVASTAVQANVRGRDGAYYFPGDPRSAFVGLQFRY